MARRTDAAIAAVAATHRTTDQAARAIVERLDLDPTPISVRAADYWNVRAPYQAELAGTIVVSVATTDPTVAERLAAALKAAL